MKIMKWKTNILVKLLQQNCNRSVKGKRYFCQDAYTPLEGIRVLDLTRILAGPYCTMLLGDLGAEVIKIENPENGDDTRLWGPPWITKGHSAYFLSVNRNKKSVAINMKTKDGSDIIKQLAAKCDVLVENYVPGKLTEMGLDYDNLKEVNPRLIYTSVTGFGQTGPYAKRAGYDNIAAAVGGLMHITGPVDGEPCRVGVAMTDLSTGLYAYGAIMAAILHRHQSGKGQHIDTNLLNTQVATLTHIASNYLNCGAEAKRYGTGHGSIVPYQAFKTKDSYIMVGAGNEGLYQDMCSVMGLNHLATDPRFSCNEDRVNNRDQLIDILVPIFLEKTTKEWIKVFDKSKIPYGPINSIKEVFEDEQVLHNDMIQEIDHGTLGKIKIAGPAVRYSEGKLGVRLAPPLLGEHTDEVLTNMLGFDREQIHNMRQANVIK